jgi:cytochrome P450
MSQAMNVPPHVPPELVYDFDCFAAVPPGLDAQEHWRRLRDEAPGEVFWTPRHGGNWVATRAEDIVRIQLEHETFSHALISIPRETAFPMYPLTLDPPEQAAYRRLIQPAFMPKAIAALETRAREVAVEQIERLAPRGECEFVGDFARVLPIVVFLEMVDLPLGDAGPMMQWTEVMTRSADPAERNQALGAMSGYLQGWLQRRAEAPGTDLLSTVVTAEIDGRKLSGEEIMAMCLLLLFGGLDTVASMLSFIARFLALNPAHRRELAREPGLIPQAVEELIRRHAVANTCRLVKQDLVLKGAPLKAGDQIQAPNVFVGLDEATVVEPMRVDFHRERPIPHAAFGNGVHTCPGAVLARREIKVFLEEWLARIPDFAIKPGTTPVVEAGNVSGVVELQLSWPVG